MRDIWGRVAASGGAKLVSLALLTISIFVSARWLGPAGRGIAAAVATCTIVAGTLAHCSLGQVALQERASRRRIDNGTLLGTLGAFAVSMTVLTWGVVGVIAAVPNGPLSTIPRGPLMLGLCALPFVIWEQYGSYMLMSLDCLPVYNRAQVLGRSIELVLVLFLVATLGLGVRGAIGADVLGQATVSTYGIRTLLRHANGRWRCDRQLLLRLLSSGVRLHLSAVGTLLVAYVDVLVVQRYLGAHDTGIYQLAVQGVALMLVIPQAASQVLYTRVAAMGPDGAWTQQRYVIAGVLLGLGVAGFVAVLLGPAVIAHVAGADFLPTIPLFKVLLWSVVGRSVGVMMGPQWIGRGLFWQASLVTVLIGVLDVTLAIVLVQRVGVFGAAYASVIAYTVGAIVNAVLAVQIQRARARVAAGAEAAGAATLTAAVRTGIMNG